MIKKNEIIAILERSVYRLASALVTLMLAIICGPAELGIYAAGTIVLNLSLSVLEIPLRQAIAGELGDGRLPKNTSKFVFKLGLYGVGVVAIGLLCMLLFRVVDLEAFVKLTVFVPVPLIVLVGIPKTAVLEAKQKWSFIIFGQLIAFVTSISIAFALLPIIGAGAATAQTILAEGLLLVWVTIWGEKNAFPSSDKDIEFPIDNMLSGLFSWLQSQADKLVLSFMAGQKALGVYTFGVSLVRTFGDTVNSGINNHLRAQLANSRKKSNQTAILRRALKVTLSLALVQQLCIALVGPFIVEKVLGQEWIQLKFLIPLLGVSLVLGSMSWTLSNFLVINGRAMELRKWQVGAVAITIVAGVFMSHNLIIGYWVILVRDFVTVISRSYVCAKKQKINVLPLVLIGILAAVLVWLIPEEVFKNW